MRVKFFDETFNCVKAVKHADSAILHLSDGGTVEFGGVNDWSSFSLDGGTWSAPDVTPEEQFRADLDFLAVMTGVSL